MRWHRRKSDPSTLEEHTEAHKALHKAEDDLTETRDRNREITETVKKAVRLGESNNFAEMILKAMGGAK